MDTKIKFRGMLFLIPLFVLIYSSYKLYENRHETYENPLRFDSTSLNLGILNEPSSIKHTFHFINTTNKAWLIRDVKTSCSCTTADLSEKRVLPGGRGSITLSIDPKLVESKFDKSAFLWIDKIPQPLKLTLSGYVKPIISISPVNVYFSDVEAGRSSSKTVLISNVGNNPVRITKIDTSCSFIKWRLQKNVVNSKEALTLTVHDPPIGDFDETVTVHTSVQSGAPIVLRVAGKSISKWKLSSPHVFFGFVNIATYPVKQIKISSLPTKSVIQTYTDAPWAKASIVSDGSSGVRLLVRLNLADVKEGDLNANVHIRINDAVSKELIIPITGIVQDPSNCHCHQPN